VGCAVAHLLRGRLVAGRGAADDRGDPGVAELEPVVAGDACGLAGKSEFVQDGIHEITGAVAGKGAARAVRPVGPGSEAKDQDAGARVAEAGDGTGPVGLVLIGATPGFADAAAVVAKAGAAGAIDDGLVDLLQKRRKRLNFGSGHCIP